MARRNRSVTSLERRLLQQSLDWHGRYDPPPPKVIGWPALPPPITEERRRANLARSAEIRTALQSYLGVNSDG